MLDAEHTPAAVIELCRRYGISRKTCYKWLDRYARLGSESLADRAHLPQWNVFFGPIDLGWLDERDDRIHDRRGRAQRERHLLPIR